MVEIMSDEKWEFKLPSKRLYLNLKTNEECAVVGFFVDPVIHDGALMAKLSAGWVPIDDLTAHDGKSMRVTKRTHSSQYGFEPPTKWSEAAARDLRALAAKLGRELSACREFWSGGSVMTSDSCEIVEFSAADYPALAAALEPMEPVSEE